MSSVCDHVRNLYFLTVPPEGKLTVGLVSRLQYASQKRILGHGLGHGARVDARGTEIEQPLHPGLKSLVNDIGLNHQIVIDEVRRIGVVGVNPTHPGRCQNHHIRAHILHEGMHRGLISEIQLDMGAGDQLHRFTRGSPAFQPAQNGATDHPAMAGDVDFRRIIHQPYKTGDS